MEGKKFSGTYDFNDFLNTNTLLVVILSKDLDVIYANAFTSSFFGVEIENLIGKKLPEIPYKTDIHTLIDIDTIKKTFLSGQEAATSIVFNGSHLQLGILPIKGPDDAAVNSVVLLGKIDDPKNKQETVEDSVNPNINNIIDHVPAFIFWKDSNSIFLGCNKAFAKSAGLTSPNDIIGKTDYDLPWSKEESDAYREDDRKIIQSGQAKLNIEESQTFPDGKTIYLLTNKVPLFNETGKVTGILGIYNDITQLKNTQHELNNTLKLLTKSNKAKSEFIANMSHDIRTPITGILAMSQDMMNAANKVISSLQHPSTENSASYYSSLITTLSATVHQDCQLLIGATDELLQLCNEILEVVRLESGKAEENLESFNLSALIEHNIELLQPVARHKKIRLCYTLDKNLPQCFRGSRIYLDRVLLNLISNALKFTEQGSVKISASLLEKSNANAGIGETIYLCLSVTDTGIGVPKDKFDTIFEHFSRLTSSYEGIYKGSGLGLYTVKRYIEAMKGHIRVESELDKGTCFTITLPLTVANHADHTKKSVRPLKITTQSINDNLHLKDQETLPPKDAAASVLIVEDNTLAAIAIKLALKPFNCSIDVAKNGDQAVHMAYTEKYDLILMDIGLPDFSGIEVTKQIRAFNNSKKSQVPIVALTGHAGDPNMRRQSLEAGMQEVLNKPVQPLALDSILQQYVFTLSLNKPNEPPSTSTPKKTTNSIVIDWEACVHMCHGEPDLTRQMLSVLADDLKTTKTVLADAYKNRDIKALRAELHRSRGGVCYLKLPQLEHALKNFHQAVKLTPKNKKVLDATYIALEEAMRAFWIAWEMGKF